MSTENKSIRTSIAPWLTVTNGQAAVDFYKLAFGAEEIFHLESPEGDVVARLSVNGAEFWVSGDAAKDTAQSVGAGTVRMILTVANPDELFARALKAGATEIFQVGEEHGWRLGRLADPFGLHWEIGYELSEE